MTIAEKLKQLKRENRKALTPFSTVGDPDAETSLEIFRRFGGWGADIMELGIPYSDPLMDGPTLQRSNKRALDKGFKLAGLAQFIEDIKKHSDTPLLIMTCFNPIYRYGVKRFFKDMSSAGTDALLVTDLPPEEWGENLDLAKSFNLGTIFLVTQTTSEERMKLLDKVSNPFVYCVSKTGVTGAGAGLPDNLGTFAQSVTSTVSQPVLIGFGISTPEQARETSALADGVVIGSAIANIIEQNLDSNETILHNIGGFLTSVRRTMDQ